MKTLLVPTLVSALASVASVAGAADFANGQYLNGQYLNGQYLNGQYLNGQYLNGQYLNGGTYNGSQVSGIVTNQGQQVYYASLDGSAIRGWAWVWSWSTYAWNWQQISNAELAGATLTSSVSDGSTITLRINSIATSGAQSLYSLDGHLNGNWHSLCGTENGAPVRAIPIQGEWSYSTSGRVKGGGGRKSLDPNKLTFACVSTAIGKCAASGLSNTLGYAPWRGGWYQRPDANGNWTWIDGTQLHETCVRMIRGDYCGAGHSYTLNGTAIDVTDYLYYRVNQPRHDYMDGRNGAPWAYEAMWDRNGAADISCSRVESPDFQWTNGYFQCPAVLGPNGFESGRRLTQICWSGVDPTGRPMGPYFVPDSFGPTMTIANRTSTPYASAF